MINNEKVVRVRDMKTVGIILDLETTRGANIRHIRE